MHRIDGDGAVDVIPTPESVGSTVGYFQKGNPATGTRATQVTADWCNAIQEEIAGAIENKGISLDKTNRGQLKMAIARRKIRSVINSNLTIDPADLDELFLVSTGNSNRTISLPPASEMVGVEMKFLKVDAGVGSVELVPHGSETINGSTSYVIRVRYGFLTLVSDGTNWNIVNISSDQEEILVNLTGSGNYTGGLLKFTRNGKIVTVDMLELVTHPSNSSPSSGPGLVPTRFRPDPQARNTYTTFSTGGLNIIVKPDGSIDFSYNGYSGSPVSRQDAGGEARSGLLTYAIASANYQPNVGPL